jgi:myosin heavy subunit
MANCWVEDPKECFVLCRESDCAGTKVVSAHDPNDDAQQDLVQMSNVDTANILNNLRVRHKAGLAYTNAGKKGIVISVNPYRWINIYGTNVMRDHHEAMSTKEMPPHVFSIAADAYKALCSSGESQTVVTSGESGSGKTENAKQVFRFLAEIAGVDGVGGGSVSMQELLIQANPVLEAFGNSKTLRNDNSSRFGKLVNVHFDGSGRIVGAATRNYLLEKTRVSAPPASERNFHAFYQLLSMPPDEKAKRSLKGVGSHALLTKSMCTSVDGLDDAAEWEATAAAMDTLGFSAAEVESIIDVTSSLLHLGDLVLETDTSFGSHGDDYAKLGEGSKQAAILAAGLLGVDSLALTKALIQIQVRDTTNTLSVAAARKNRDAFVASVYSRLFDRLVERINGAAGNDIEQLEGSRFIGVLDIFGFEIFEVNSFEQLCINFANEKLQRNFTMTTFQQEEGLYTAEGIDFKHIEYVDNSLTLELLDKSGEKGLGAQRGARGIFQILDEEVHLPRTTDDTFLDKLNAAFGTEAGSKGGGGHPAYSTDFKKPKLFTIAHYAGQVEYNPSGFLE